VTKQVERLRTPQTWVRSRSFIHAARSKGASLGGRFALYHPCCYSGTTRGFPSGKMWPGLATSPRQYLTLGVASALASGGAGGRAASIGR